MREKREKRGEREERREKRRGKKEAHFFSLSLFSSSFSLPPPKQTDLTHWRTTLADRWDALSQSVSIAVIGKYTGLSDAYLSVIKALQHACLAANRKLDLQWVEAEKLEPRGEAKKEEKEKPEENGAGEPSSSAAPSSSGPGGDGKAANGGDSASWATLEKADGILVPGGFGGRGVEGKILAAGYARTAKKPYLGICLGMQVRSFCFYLFFRSRARRREEEEEKKPDFEKYRRKNSKLFFPTPHPPIQLAVVEYARNVLNLPEANSTEFEPATPHPAVVFMPEGSTTHKGGTMRLGARKTALETVDCVAARLYQADRFIDERHRHRYEVNPTLVPALEKAGLRFVGKDETGERMEIVELDASQGHPFFVAAQFHPEFKSRPGRPSPLFLGLVLAASGKLDAWMSGNPLSPGPGGAASGGSGGPAAKKAKTAAGKKGKE